MNVNVIQGATPDLLQAFYDDDAFVLEGLSTSKESLDDFMDWLMPWLKESKVKRGIDIFVVTGDIMNHHYSLIGDNRYPDELNIVIVNKDVLDYDKYDQFNNDMWKVGMVWFRDLVDRNERNNRFEKLFEKANAGDRDAMMDAVTNSLLYNRLDRNDKREMIRHLSYLETLVQSGNSAALIMLGEEFLRGTDDYKDVESAMLCFETAGEMGEHMGYECLGELFFTGEHVPVDYEKAYSYFEKAKQGERELSFASLYYLGEMYRMGLFLPQDYDKAIDYYKKIVY